MHKIATGGYEKSSSKIWDVQKIVTGKKSQAASNNGFIRSTLHNDRLDVLWLGPVFVHMAN
jgi:hypothetical protein